MDVAAEGTADPVPFETHVVANQPPELAPYDAWVTDAPLREAVAREGGGWAELELSAYGKRAGGELLEAGRIANEHKPEFLPFDRFGHRVDRVDFHPAYHQLMKAAVEAGVPNFTWRHVDRAGANVARMALSYLHNQADAGTSCPLTMTYACVPALRHQPDLASAWLGRITAPAYDGTSRPAWDKPGNTIGMGMTEKQGGSDVRANTTRAWPLAQRGPGQLYRLIGHKWFFSAPMCDAHLVLAYADGGLSCFLLPRFAPDGQKNAVAIQRLKDKLGDWSNASAEVEFRNAAAWLIGEEGRGVATILEMVALTRQDCMIGSASVMRRALVEALHHTRYRKAFGKLLIEQPLMKNVLADLALESEAHTALAARIARAVGASPGHPAEAALARIGTAIGKYWVCKRATPFVNEAQECLGGNGYIEEAPLARLYRQAPLNSIWEGSGNIQCLDVLRAAAREPASREALFAELDAAHGNHPALDAEVGKLRCALDDLDTLPLRARRLTERFAVALEAALLVRAGNRPVADAFCESRLTGDHGAAFGTLPASAPLDVLIARAFPA